MQEKIQSKKEAALQATLELISEQGFHGTPMSQIAQKANIGVGTIYRYFPSKEDLINTLYIHVKTRMAQHILGKYSKSMPVHESYLLLIRSSIDYFITHPEEFLFMEQYSNSPMITVDTRHEGLRMFAPVSHLFMRAREEELFKELPDEILNSIAHGATMALVKLWLFSEVKPDDATLNAGIDAIWDAVKR